MMRLSFVIAAVCLIGLAGCEAVPKAPAAPVQANQASDSQSPDGSQQAPRSRHKVCPNTGSRLCSDVPDVDPSVGGAPAGGLGNATSNGGGGPH